MTQADEPGRWRRLVAQVMTAVPHARALGLEFVASGPDWAELKLPWAPGLVAYPETGVIASGAIFSLMDSAAGFAVLLKAGAFEPTATLDLRCDYLRPAHTGQAIHGRVECYKLTRSIAFVRGIAHDGDAESPVAHISGTFMRTTVE